MWSNNRTALRTSFDGYSLSYIDYMSKIGVDILRFESESKIELDSRDRHTHVFEELGNWKFTKEQKHLYTENRNRI